MGVEIEAKMKVADLEQVRQKLRERHASLMGEHLETNIFFDTDDRSLLAADEGLRLRLDHDVRTLQEQYTLTFKGPRQQGQLKSRDEIEVTVGNAENTSAFLRCLGYQVVLSFEKRRQSWELDGCKVELDEVPHLGTFVEIEGPSEEAVLRVRESLEMSDHAIVKASYIAMLMTYLQEHGLSERVIVFDSPDRTARAG